MGSQMAAGGAPRPGGSTDKDKNKGKTAGGTGGFAAAGQKGYDKAVNPGNQNLGLAGPGYSGPRGVGTGIDAGNPSNRLGKPTESGGTSKSSPQKNLPTGVTPLSTPKPMGATTYVEGADLLGIGARVFGGIGAAAMSALTQGITGTDTTQEMLGQHLGKQVGWSADPSMTPGRDRAQRGSKRESFDQTNLGSTEASAADRGSRVPSESDAFSDIQLADRRKPGLKQMLESML